MKKKILISLTTVILLSFSLIASGRPVEIITPETKNIDIYRVVNGTIEPYKEIQLSSSVGGNIEEMKVKAGQYIQEGDPLLIFEQTDIIANIEQAKAGLEIARANLEILEKGAQDEQLISAEASVKQAEAGLTIAKSNYQLLKKGVSEEDLESLEATYEQALASYEGAKETLSLIESGFEDKTMLKQQLLNAETQQISAEKQLATAGEGLKQALNAKEQAENALKQAENEFERIKSLYQENVTTKNQYEMVEVQYKNAQTALNNADSAVSSAEIAKEQAEAALKGAEDNYILMKESYNNPTELEQQLSAARTQLEVSEANKRMARANLDKAHKGAREEEIETALANIEQAKASLEMAKAQHTQVAKGASSEDRRIAEANVTQAKAVLDQAEKALADSTVKSPINGIIANVNFEQGEIAPPGNPLFVIVNLDKVYIKADLTANILKNIKEGQEITSSLLDYPGEYIKGVVDFLSPTLNPQTQAYTVRILSDSPAEFVRAGMFVDLYIQIDSKEDTLVLPIDAVLDLDSNPFVYKVKDDQAEKVFVETGIVNHREVEIIEGISERDRVVIRGQKYLDDGDIVEVIN
ncbi:MAG: efflux RND transporter periplasmic adaptor subunit [Halanaerobiales bacterium]